jgi:hypothetical protein
VFFVTNETLFKCVGLLLEALRWLKVETFNFHAASESKTEKEKV